MTCCFFGLEGGVRRLDYLGVRDPALALFVPDRLGVLDRRPGVLIDTGDGGLDGSVHPHRDGEPRARCPAGVHDIGTTERRVRAHHQQATGAAGAGGADGLGHERCRPRAEFDGPLRSLVAAITGADRGVETMPSSAFRPLTLLYP